MAYPATPELVRMIVLEALNREPSEPPRHIGSGTVNSVFAVRIGDYELAVRVCDEWRGADEHSKESQCIELAANCGVPVPTVVATGLYNAVPYMIQEFIPGVGGKSSDLDRTDLWRTLGQYAKLIHAIPIDTTNSSSSPLLSRGLATWRTFVDYNVGSLNGNDELLRLGVYSISEQPLIRALFERLCAGQFNFGLMHGDLLPRNTLIDTEGTVHLIDWGCADFQIVPHYELSSIFTYHDPHSDAIRAFVDGYDMTSEDFDAILPEIDCLRLLQAFDLVRWSIDRRAEELGNYTENARKALRDAYHLL